MKLRILPPEDIIDGIVELPWSKSMANRRLIIDALAGESPSELDPSLCGTDIITLRDALACGHMADPNTCTDINIGGCGTAMRFLTAYYSAMPGSCVRLDGNDRMRQRPVGPLVEALRSLGARITYLGTEGSAPLLIEGTSLEGGEVTVDARMSSQFISALMMIGPSMEHGLTIQLDGQVKSEPYIRMTLGMMCARGVDAIYYRDERRVIIKPGHYAEGAAVPMERDWSAMAFWMELCAVSGGFITVRDLDRQSLQGDRAVMEIFAGLGAVEAEPDDDDDDDDDDNQAGSRSHSSAGPGDIELCGTPDLNPRLVHDFTGTPDLAQPALVACCLTGIPFKATGLETLASKETDRIAAIIEEMGRMGFVISNPDAGTLEWEGRRLPIDELPAFDAHGDHRMAMSLAPVALFVPGITIDGAECVDKSYPGYWHQLESLGFTLEEMPS